MNINSKKAIVLALAASLISVPSLSAAANSQSTTPAVAEVSKASLINTTTVDVVFENKQRLSIDFYGNEIFRLFQDKDGGIIRDPQATPEAQILVDSPRQPVQLTLKQDAHKLVITTSKIRIELDKKTTLFKVYNLQTGKCVIELVKPIEFNKGNVKLHLKERANEYFYGGGVQNGRFSHKGNIIAIENQNSWTDGGVASPTPFYWSTEGYGMMWHTFKKGFYNFGAENSGIVEISHTDNYLDLFFMVSDGAVPLLNDFYQLTGKPVFFPKFGFYQGHLNAYNRDYWTEVDKDGILFEDGKRYKESANPDTGVQETLNGEKGVYQFSARAAIDRYIAHDMPLGWFLPNDGYGAGYGQTGTIDGNIENLNQFTLYAQSKGIEVGLWTQSDLHPKEGVEALLQRDIVKEVRDAGVRVLKTDVAWVGPGYSFGLNGVADAAQIMTYYGNDARPFIISLDGWAGTQRYAGIWSGDQSGGEWEYIRFHIPTYIGAGLSGQPNISSDMDGIFGGKNLIVNTRDFQWKSFTTQLLNMDGWGANEKYPHALGEPATSINRNYLKLRSALMPYIYSVARESVDGLPILRAMFLEDPNAYTLGKGTQYQFMLGGNFLIAPIYQATQSDAEGNDIRDGIYLPEGSWVDYFSGQIYQGGVIINNIDAPLWKLPVFVKQGAIIPMSNVNNNVTEIDKSLRKYEIYPMGKSSFTEYDDDGLTMQYQQGASASTLIESDASEQGRVTISIQPTKGSFEGFVPTKRTELVVNATQAPRSVSAIVGESAISLTPVSSLDEFNSKSNVYYYDPAPSLNKYATAGSEFAKKIITKNPQILVKLDPVNVQLIPVSITIDGFRFAPEEKLRVSTGQITAPAQAQVTDENTQPFQLTPSWDKVAHADYYEIQFDGQIYSTIRNQQLAFTDLTPDTAYSFQLRAVNKDMVSDWVDIKAKTKSNPLQWAISGITATCTAACQGSQEIAKLVDFDEKTAWHTDWQTKIDKFDILVDLNSVNQLDKLQYVPHSTSRNGVIEEGTISYSDDKKTWSEPVAFQWKKDGSPQIVTFDGKPTVRYIKIAVSKATGQFGSGQELYVFKVPGSASYIPGDINSDGKIDNNDMTSYGNYTGLRGVDSDFEYVSVGDGNKNKLIDAYDISQVAVKLGEPVTAKEAQLGGSLSMTADKESYKAGDTITLTVKGVDLKDVNALSLALPYDPAVYEYVSIKAEGMKQMQNMTKDRLHTNGVKALYPTFVNIGEQEKLAGSETLLVITFKAKKDTKMDLKMQDVILVDPKLESKEL